MIKVLIDSHGSMCCEDYGILLYYDKSILSEEIRDIGGMLHKFNDILVNPNIFQELIEKSVKSIGFTNDKLHDKCDVYKGRTA
jgi:hypothetical protein